MNPIYLKILKIIYGSIFNYVKTHPELDGESLRANIKAIFRVAPKASTLDVIINLARANA